MRAFVLLLFVAGCTPGERPAAPAVAADPVADALPLPPGTYFVLPPSQARAAGDQCSRPAPEVESGWAMTDADAQAVERRLPALAETAPERPSAVSAASYRVDLATSVRQYVGVVVGGRRLVYVNAFPQQMLDRDADMPPERQLHADQRVVVVCDGGPAFWGVVFDPATGTFSGLDFNGSA